MATINAENGTAGVPVEFAGEGWVEGEEIGIVVAGEALQWTGYTVGRKGGRLRFRRTFAKTGSYQVAVAQGEDNAMVEVVVE